MLVFFSLFIFAAICENKRTKTKQNKKNTEDREVMKFNYNFVIWTGVKAQILLRATPQIKESKILFISSSKTPKYFCEIKLLNWL